METLYAKVIDLIVVSVHAVTMEFIEANPERYGPAALWHQTYFNTEGKTYAGIGYTYDPATQDFTAPPPPIPFPPA